MLNDKTLAKFKLKTRQALSWLLSFVIEMLANAFVQENKVKEVIMEKRKYSFQNLQVMLSSLDVGPGEQHFDFLLHNLKFFQQDFIL